MATVYSYMRFSSFGQADGDSMDRQEQAAVSWAQTHGYELAEPHKDPNYSGFKGRHRAKGALSRFLKEIADGDIERGSVLLVEAIDRLSREGYVKATKMITLILDAGITIITLEDGNEYSEAILDKKPDLIRTLQNKIEQANDYSKRLSYRVQKGKEKGRATKLAAKRPITRMCPSWLKVVEDETGSRYMPIPERVEVIRDIFDQLDRDVSKLRIAKNLNERCVPQFDRAGQGLKSTKPKKVHGWYLTSISKIAHNRALIGEFQPTKKNHSTKTLQVGEAVQQIYPVVIDRELFERVQLMKKPAGRRGKEFANILTGLVKCDHCKYPMVFRKSASMSRVTITSPEKKVYAQQQYLQCTAAKKHFRKADRQLVCDNQAYVPYFAAEATIVAAATNLIRLEEFAQQNHNRDQPDDGLDDNAAAIADAENRYRTITNSFGRNPSPMMAKMIGDLDAEVEQLTAARKTMLAKRDRAKARVVDRDYRQLYSLLEKAKANKNQDTRYEMRARIHGILSRCIDVVIVGTIPNQPNLQTGLYDFTSKYLSVWLAGGRMLCTVVDGHRSMFAIMGKRMWRLDEDGSNIETETPAEVYAQHLQLARGISLSVADAAKPLPGVMQEDQAVIYGRGGERISNPVKDILHRESPSGLHNTTPEQAAANALESGWTEGTRPHASYRDGIIINHQPDAEAAD